MNKFFIFLTFASFALLACSDDTPPPEHSDLCKKSPITKECLKGRWFLESVEGHRDCTYDGGGILKLEADGNYSFNSEKTETHGTWKLTENADEMEIICKFGECIEEIADKPFNVKIEVQYPGTKLRVINEKFASFSELCSGNSFTEIFSWQGF